MVKARKTTKGSGKAGAKKSVAKAKPKAAAKPKPKAKAAAKPKPALKAKPKKPAPAAKVVARPKQPAVRTPPPRPAPAAAAPRAVEPEPVAPPTPARPPRRPLDPALRADIVRALAQNGYDDAEPGVIDTLTAVAAGYRKGPADAPPAMAAYADKAVADGIVELYKVGDSSPVVGRRMARPAVRATVDFDLRQLGPDETGDEEREVLMCLCLGLWDPDRDTFAVRDGIAAFVGRWYRAGLGLA